MGTPKYLLVKPSDYISIHRRTDIDTVFMPTMPFASAGQMILPSVSVPIATAARPTEIPTADPEELPEGS